MNMLLYKDGCFYGRYISFVLPDGLYLDTNPPLAYDYGISAWDEKEQIRFDICEDDTSKTGDIKKDMQQHLFEDGDSFEADSPIMETELNGLTGYEVFYHENKHDLYEVWFKLPEGQTCVFFAQCPRGKTENVKELPVVKRFLENINGNFS